MADKFQLVDADFGPDTNAEVEHYVFDQLESLIRQHSELHTSLLPRWRRVYLGKPAEETRNFPFPNAANTVVQVVGETVDTMVARVMGLVWATHPLWAFQNFVKTATPEEGKENELQRSIIESFMDTMGFEPSELNLHEHEALWYTEAANLGTAFLKLNVEDQTEAVVVGYSDAAKKTGFKGNEVSVYQGPRVSNLRHEDFMADASANSIEGAEFVTAHRRLSRFNLEERGFLGIYDKDAVAKIVNSPDRAAPPEPQRQELQDQGISPSGRPDTTAEWDIYECYFAKWHNGRKYRLIYTVHKASKTVLRRVFNFLPMNQVPIKRAKLGYRTSGMYGHGYAELLEIYQEELSTVHNQRLDNATVANIRALRVSPRARALDTNCELYPAALFVAEKDELESIQVGDVYPSTFKNEEMTLGLVARRAGVSPAVSGAGAGGMQKRPAQYSASGTLAVMQENNSVVGFATSEFRHAHVQLGTSLCQMYNQFGTNGKEQMFGLDSERLAKALARFGSEQGLRIPIRSATGSLNRETEKQTGMIIAGLLQRHYTAVGQLIQAINNPMAPPEFKEYAQAVVLASEMFHKKIVKDFGYDNPDLYIPEVKGRPQGSQPQNPGNGGQGGMAPQGAPVAGASPAGEGSGGPMVPNGPMGSPASGPLPVAR